MLPQIAVSDCAFCAFFFAVCGYIERWRQRPATDDLRNRLLGALALFGILVVLSCLQGRGSGEIEVKGVDFRRAETDAEHRRTIRGQGFKTAAVGTRLEQRRKRGQALRLGFAPPQAVEGLVRLEQILKVDVLRISGPLRIREQFAVDDFRPTLGPEIEEQDFMLVFRFGQQIASIGRGFGLKQSLGAGEFHHLPGLQVQPVDACIWNGLRGGSGKTGSSRIKTRTRKRTLSERIFRRAGCCNP